MVTTAIEKECKGSIQVRQMEHIGDHEMHRQPRRRERVLPLAPRPAEPGLRRLPQSPVGPTRHYSFPFRSLIRAHDTAELGFDLKHVATPRKADLCPKEDYRPGSDRSIRCALSWPLLRNLHDSINCERHSLRTLHTVWALRAHCKRLARRPLRSSNSNRRPRRVVLADKVVRVATIAKMMTNERSNMHQTYSK